MGLVIEISIIIKFPYSHQKHHHKAQQSKKKKKSTIMLTTYQIMDHQYRNGSINHSIKRKSSNYSKSSPGTNNQKRNGNCTRNHATSKQTSRSAT